MENNAERKKIEFKIERAVEDDVPTVQALNKKLFDYEISNGFDENLDPNWAFSAEGKAEITERITSEDSCGFVVKVGDQVVGYIIGLIREEETGRSESRYAEAEHMFVEEVNRGGGIGEKLVEEFKVWAREKGLKMVKVNVSFKNEQAIEFYKKVGLMPVDVTMRGEI